jgi:hypothetical protein
MRRILYSLLLLAAMLLAACTGDRNDENPAGDNPAPALSVGEASDPLPADDDPENGGEEAAPEANEGPDVSTINAPPEGRYEVTYSPGTTTCPDVGTFDFPAAPNEFIDIVTSEDLLTVTVHTGGDSIPLGLTESVSESGEVTYAWEGVLTAGGLDLVYTMYYDVFGLGDITGNIYNLEQGCETNRGFTAERVGP